ncbi:MAG: hypothetical protein A2X49_17240 [Lentisphaerae bacterium GWF2_52_8]|nr:MAG: hypothetical protein A2X49_17240 [Lentisphaerae bacterium GWF2_52_8]
MLEYIFDGGIMMFPLMFLSVIAFAVIIDRALAFKAAEKDTRGLRLKVRDSLEEGKIDEAINECQTCGGPVAAILMVGLVKFRKLLERGKTLTEIEVNVNKTMNDYSPHVIDTLEKRIGLLPVIASISPLLGMTGTVTGMINSFDAMSKSSALEATAVSAGISEALITTAAGLLIAMPAVIAYNIFSKRVDRFILEIEESSTELIDHITLDYEIEK